MSTSPDDPVQTDVLAAEEPLPEHARASMMGFLPRWLRVISLPVIFVVGAGFLIHVPYYSLGPGPATDVLSLIQARGAKTYPSKGKLLLTTASVSDSELTLWDMLYVWVDPNVGTIHRSRLRAPGVTDEQVDAENARAMEESKVSAEVAAFRALGKKVTVLPGARVLTVLADAPADGKLRGGDLIVAVAGARVSSPEQAVEAVQRHRIGQAVEVTFRRDGKTSTVTITTRPALNDASKPAVGVTLGRAFRLPHDIEIDTQRIGGPSGGLVFALSIVDAFTEEDLTRGYVVAATGTIESGDAQAEADVGAVGAIGEKIRGAIAVGAEIFLAPADEAAAARAAAPSSLKVIGVRTLEDAVDALRALPAKTSHP